MNQDAVARLAFALDVDSFEEAEKWTKLLHGKVGLFKVGKQLFTRCGPDVVRMIRAEGCGVFLDLKYHDIPNTVSGAVMEACRLGVRMVNVHALGGEAMMRAAREAVDRVCTDEGLEPPVLVAVTVLTSSDDETLRSVGIDRPVTEMVPRLAALAKKAGLDGVVASPREVGLIRESCGQDFTVVTPGVRPSFAAVNDQKRVTTPADAICAGADYLVVGRPISCAPDPAAAAEMIVDEMAAAMAEKHG